MGSDLHMNPPTPDETRLVRSGDHTALYRRHTDGIFGDTTTWHRRGPAYLDPDMKVFDALKTTTGCGSTTLHYSVHLSEELDMEDLGVVDVDYLAERDRLMREIQHAKRQAEAAWQKVVTAEINLRDFERDAGVQD